MTWKPPIRGRVIKKTIKPLPDLVGSVGSVVELVGSLTTLKNDIVSTVDTKLEQVDAVIEDVSSRIDELKTLHQGDPGKDADEDLIVQRVLDQIEIPQNGIDADEEAIYDRLVQKIPNIDEGKIIKKVIAALPDRKADLKIIQENIEIDPMSVIEKIMALPEEDRNKLKLKEGNIDGLNQTISAFRNQLSRGYLHGGGLSTVSHDDTLTGTGTPQDPLSVVGEGGGGSNNVYNEKWFDVPGNTVDSVATVFTILNDFNPGTTRIYLNGARQELNYDYFETGDNQITFVLAPETGSRLFWDYETLTTPPPTGELQLEDDTEFLLENGTPLELET